MRSERIASAVGLVAPGWCSLAASIHPFRLTKAVPCRIDEESGARWRNRTPVAAVQRASPATDGIGQNGATRRNQTSVSALRGACSVTELWRRKWTNGTARPLRLPRDAVAQAPSNSGRSRCQTSQEGWSFGLCALLPNRRRGGPCAVLNWIPRPLFGCRHARREPIRPPRLRADGQDEQMGA